MRYSLVLLLVCAAQSGLAATPPPLPAGLQSFFRPPAEFAGQLGSYVSPLKFYDGRPVASPAEWPARRAEILKYWHDQMGPWPPLLEKPKIEYVKTERRENFTQHRVRVELDSGLMHPAISAGA